ncbi:hypothetical protein [Streptomyces cacaoi]|uniref:hypothetical protein n=1 Tax=Streptomyces cacaoi TaxID=1898 RepID=UPI00331822BF
MSDTTVPVSGPRSLTTPQKVALTGAFVPMLATGVAGGIGTFSNISATYGRGTALGAVAAGEGATLVLALTMLGLTMLGQSSPWQVRAGLWALPAAASTMAAMAADGPARTVIYAVTPMGMCLAAEGMAFLARRIVIHTNGRDAEAERKAAHLVRSLAYHRARATSHPSAKAQKRSVRASWRLARKVGTGDEALGERLIKVQRERVTEGADAALADMFSVSVTPSLDAVTDPGTPAVTPAPAQAELEAPAAPETETAEPRDGTDMQVTPDAPADAEAETVEDVTAVTPDVAAVEERGRPEAPDAAVQLPEQRSVTLEEVAAVTGVLLPEPGDTLTDEQLIVVLRYLRYSADPPLSYRQAATAFRERGFVGSEGRLRAAWGSLMTQEENA